MQQRMDEKNVVSMKLHKDFAVLVLLSWIDSKKVSCSETPV